MAKIVDNKGYYDYFEVKCQHCGSIVRYSRKEIRAHRRWPNGFVYCPKCKNPIGHFEQTLKGNALEDKKVNETATKASQMESVRLISKEEYRTYKDSLSSIQSFRILFLIFGILLIVGGFILFLIGSAEVIPPAAGILIGLFAIHIGIGLLIMRGAFLKRLYFYKKQFVDKYEHSITATK